MRLTTRNPGWTYADAFRRDTELAAGNSALQVPHNANLHGVWRPACLHRMHGFNKGDNMLAGRNSGLSSSLILGGHIVERYICPVVTLDRLSVIEKTLTGQLPSQ